MKLDVLEKKREVDQETEEPRDGTNGGYAVHVFGIDSMSTKDITRYFDSYGPSWVEWINDSSCNVVFEDEAAIKRVLIMMAIPPNNDESQIETNLLLWREAIPFTRQNSELVYIHMRRATLHDRRPERPNPNSAWARSLQRKQRPGRKKNRKRSHHDADMQTNPAEGLETGEETRRKKRQLSTEDAQRMATMLGRDLRSIIDQRAQAAAPAEDEEMAQADPGNADADLDAAADIEVTEANVDAEEPEKEPEEAGL
eukprot:TRINITY_DN27505_c0_g1_i1.p1 TRINITY_DN27505_c0_g1~~TRINITY_DN27505_c0_g1_i1.p1  ORF type:complete len:255 (-),score=60.37 TRINITY_DN27505_c0_g1_i1:294-1058(-)